MKMEKIETNLLDCYILEPKRFGDKRGYFESVTKEQLEELGFNGIYQVSNSKSGKGIVRGLHFQKDPYCQAKVVRCHRGGVLDVVVDMRKDSETYGKYTAVELTPENGRMLYVPRGFAHGFVALEEDTLFEYYVDNKYMPRMEGGILWNDPELNINWNEIFEKYGIEEPILSDKDINRCTLKESDVEFLRQPKKYLITGFKGQLGYDIARELDERGEHEYLAIDKDEMDITNRDEVMEVVKNYNPDVIFHCAAWTAVDKAEEMEDIVRKVNVEGTKNIIDLCLKHNVKKLVYCSSTGAIPEMDKGKKITIEANLEPDKVVGCYSKSKAMATIEVLDAVKNKGLNACVVYPSGIMGPEDYALGETTKTLIKIINGEMPVGISGTFNLCDVRDLADGLIKAADKGNKGGNYILGNDAISFKEFCKLVSEESNCRKVKLFLPGWFANILAKKLEKRAKKKGEKPMMTSFSVYNLIRNNEFDSSNSKRELGYTTRSYRETIIDEIKWLKKEGKI